VTADEHRSLLFLHPDAHDYGFGPHHPWQPVRLRALVELIAALDNGDTAAPRRPEPATRGELLLAHSAWYLDAVQELSEYESGEAAQATTLAGAAGLGAGDTPAFTGMHEATSAIVGATLAATRAVLNDACRHAFSPSGGLHHAMRDRASGFCVYNDLVVAIEDALRDPGQRVLYIDLDAHHGDGVQAAFYTSPRVLTVSLHESGRYLFPGTGEVTELGEGAGLGFSVNAPLAPFTQEASWLEAVAALMPPLCARFRPTLIVSQHGCDGHAWDPLTHLALTTDAYAQATAMIHRLAHEHCDGRWVAAGGGGYQPLAVVPRAWARVWLEMMGSEQSPELPVSWLQRWAALSEQPIPRTWADPPDARPNIPRRAEIEAQNRRTVERLCQLVLP
jgi:acetoin utilization protein AcuC